MGVLALTAVLTATLVSPAAPYQQWVDEARAPTPRAEVEVLAEACPDPPFASCAKPHTIWLSPEDEPRWVFFHELGHQFDWIELDPWARTQFLKVLSWNAREWKEGPSDRPSPHEVFANAYANCAVKPDRIRTMDLRPGGFNVKPPRMRRMCQLIRNSAAWEAPVVTPPVRHGETGQQL